jgi:nucleotide-binding universal stress UspA family protein
MKILCATDFSKPADAAFRLAAWLSRWAGGTLEIVNVVPVRAIESSALVEDAPIVEGEIRRRALEKLNQLAASIAQGANLHATTSILEGTPDEAILTHARLTGADLVVIGADSRSRIERALLGSTAARTVRSAPVPVLIVPAEQEGTPPWASGRDGGRLSVVAAVDDRPASAGAIGFLKQLRKNIACDVTVLRLYWPPEEYRRLGLTGDRNLVTPDPDVVADIERSLRSAIGELPGAGTTTFAIEPTWGEPASQLLEAARTKGCDLVVVGTESRHGLSRLVHPPVAERMARAARSMPVLFVPPPTEAPHANEVPRVYTVLAATDLSAVGNRAVPFAYSLLGHGGVVELCYVHERPLPTPAYAYESLTGALDEAHRAEIEETLRALIPVDAERLGISTHVTVIDGGKAGDAIVQAAERLRTDAVTLGSYGRGGVARAVVGSVAEAVIRHARRPVLVVPPSRV